MSDRGLNPRAVPVGALLLLLLLSGPRLFAFGFGNQHQKHDYKHEVELLEEQWRTAQLAGDVATMDKLLSDDYVGISMTGQVNTKAQQLSRIRSHAFVITRIDLGEMKVKLVGQVAIVTVRAFVEGTSEGVPMNGDFRYTRIYQHSPTGGWKITNFEATRIPSRHVAGHGDADPERKPS
ncbi:MAG: hypothetical protein NVSMB3_13940 [Acidobacteriaceae bacterium]